MQTKISVLMPVLNEEDYLENSIESILSQTFTYFEFLILDDGSSDYSEQKIFKYKDKRIKYFKSKEKKGLEYQLNKGISLAEGKFIARMDADDISHKERLSKQVRFLNEHSEVDIVGTNILLIDEINEIYDSVRYPEFDKEIKFQMPIFNAIVHPSILARKELFEDISYYSNSYPYAEDLEIFLRMARKGVKMHNIQEYLYFYRKIDNEANNSKAKIQNKSFFTLGEKYLLERQSTYPIKFHLQYALLHYYYGDLKIARNHFVKFLKIKPTKIIYVLRYLVVSILGKKLLLVLREKQISSKINRYVRKLFGISLDRFGYFSDI